jgi:hypothetical protein
VRNLNKLLNIVDIMSNKNKKTKNRPIKLYVPITYCSPEKEEGTQKRVVDKRVRYLICYLIYQYSGSRGLSFLLWMTLGL